MHFEDTPEEAAFRTKARAWLEANAKLLGPDDSPADLLGVPIIRDVKGLSRATQSEREMADVNALLDGVIRMAASQLRRSAAIVKDYAALPPLLCAPQELQQFPGLVDTLAWIGRMARMVQHHLA